jgi:hypothetical protein
VGATCPASGEALGRAADAAEQRHEYHRRDVGLEFNGGGGAWVGPALTISRLWYRDGSSLGATASTFALGAADSGHAISCKVVASNKYASGYAVATLGTTQFR